MSRLARRQGKLGAVWGCMGQTRLEDREGPSPIPECQLPAVIARKVCPECQGTMVRKQARQGVGKGKAFLACTRYPACRYTEPCN